MKTFRKVQALAFVPSEDVITGFEMIKIESTDKSNFFLTYVEINYIGPIKKDKRSSPRFPIEFWNLNERVKQDLPRTNNNVESWHSRIKSDTRHNLTVNKVVDFFHLEQNNMETDLLLLFSGNQLKSVSNKIKKHEEKV
ncbi:unnamed protein product [Brachionus calyciflorus]|uniref:Uncharacterized protein n=1 Tax=Brachionus calyciflorus TaxID=104777 RepID=A0A814RT20_9BILA|nr:unnamed protein product [Brachionus calyciflorus]